MHAHRIPRFLLKALLLVSAMTSLVGCGGGSDLAGGSAGPPVDEAADIERFDVQIIPLKRGPGMLLRTDTATGQAWRMGVMDAPRWKPLLESAAGVPSPDSGISGRYSIEAAHQSRGAPTLVRTDSATGTVWRTGAKNTGPWVVVPNPDAARVSAARPAPVAADASGEASRAD